MRVTNDYFPWFPPEEYERRYALIREGMAARGLDALLIHGGQMFTGPDGGQPNVAWVASATTFFYSYVVFPREGEPKMVAFLPGHVDNTQALSVLTDIRPGGMNAGPPLAECFRELSLPRARVGLVGNAALTGASMPREHFEGLCGELPGLAFEEATAWYEGLRSPLSPAEQDFLRKGGEMTRAGLEALIEAARPGASDADLFNEALFAVQDAGGRLALAHIASTPSAAPTLCHPGAYALRREIAAGDVILAEIAAGFGGYCGKAYATLFAGAPGGDWVRLHELAAGVHRSVLEALAPGTTPRALRPLARPLEETGYTLGLSLVGGWSAYHTPPYGWEAGAETDEELDFAFAPGHAVAIAVHPVSGDRSRGLWVGGSCLITESGAEPLPGLAQEELLVV